MQCSVRLSPPKELRMNDLDQEISLYRWGFPCCKLAYLLYLAYLGRFACEIPSHITHLRVMLHQRNAV
jgi:hypothetical protein